MERPKALVVDDAPIARMAATLTLQLMGYEVDEAASPATALDMFHPAKYALIIMDYQNAADEWLSVYCENPRTGNRRGKPHADTLYVNGK